MCRLMQVNSGEILSPIHPTGGEVIVMWKDMNFYYLNREKHVIKFSLKVSHWSVQIITISHPRQAKDRGGGVK